MPFVNLYELGANKLDAFDVIIKAKDLAYIVSDFIHSV
jgi:hypothetical protein